MPGIQAVDAIPTTWNQGDEYALVGHTFSEEYWMNGSMILHENATERTTLAVSYLNTSGVEAFLVAVNNHTDKTTNTSVTIPYQMFGMHYLTNNSQEVFITANLAFLFAYFDDYNGTSDNSTGQKLPDPGNEDFYYVYPFGVEAENQTFQTKVEPHPVVKNGWGDYTFKITYHNMTAKVVPYAAGIPGILLQWWLPLLFCRFSELTFEYHIQMDNQTGEVTAETFYTIGQVTDVWFLGIHYEGVAATEIFNDTRWTIGAAHFVNILTSNYNVTNQNNQTHDISAGTTDFMDDNLTIVVGADRERAFDLDFRGSFNLYNESDNDALVASNLPAYNLLLQPRPAAIFLLLWQIPFSIEVFSIFAYSHSTQMQSTFSGPRQMVQNGVGQFDAARLWYVVEFPGWLGYKVVHDPTYTAHVNLGLMVGGGGGETTPSDGDEGGAILLLAGGAVVLIVIVLLLRRRK
jgi:hypothetical protein